MNEVDADLYAITGGAKYLALAKRFYMKKVLDPLVRNEEARGLARQYADSEARRTRVTV